MKQLTKIYVFLILFGVINTAIAQQYNFKNYSAKNGLASSIVNNIFQDSKGYIWFATQGGGISRFNGKIFKTFSKADGLISNDVTYITEDKTGNIWIATAEGVSKFNGISFTNYSTKDGLSKGVVYWILADKNNTMWFAIQDGGVNKFDGKVFQKYTQKDGLPSESVYSIVEDKLGEIWFSTGKGVAKFDGKKIINYSNTDLIKAKILFCSYIDSKGAIWFGGSSGNGIVKYVGKKFQQFNLPTELKDDFIGGITEDKKGNMWFATDHGMLKFEDNQFHLLSENQGLSANGVLCVATDYEGNIWAGTQGGGANLFNNESFVNYTDKDGLTSKNISCVDVDEQFYYLGTPGTGINLLDKKTNTFSVIKNIPEIEQINIFSISHTSKGQIWIGAQEGVFVIEKLKNNTFKLLKVYTTIAKNRVTAATKIIHDKNENTWIASYGSGVYKVTDKEEKNYSTQSGFISDNILTVFEDSKGNIWVGTKDAGVVKYNGTNFKTYTTIDGLADKAVWSITEDSNGNIYFGTGENGLSCFDGIKFKNYSIEDGLCSNYVNALQWDNYENCLWIGTEKGVNKIKLKPDLTLINNRTYGEQEGFKGIELNQNAITIDNKGLVWFGTINGLSSYNRKYDNPNMTPPKIHLNGIRLAYQTVDWKKLADSVDASTNLPYELELSHKNNHLIFDYQAFTTDNVRYTFMLEGQDEEWSPLTTNTEANFSNITPGKNYVFKVKAVNKNGIWSNDVIEFKFTVNPPWWQTWWFYTIVILTIVISVYSFIHYRTAQLAKEKKILEEKVTERTIELKDANDQLSVAFQDIKDSINYAKKIQDAILPLEDEIKTALPDSFVLFKPRDVVSGDFYWFNKKDDKIFIAAVDCTGHGVPGAFMSMIGSSLLNEIVTKKGPHDAASILKKLHQGVRKSLKQDRDSYESKDGMDLALSIYDTAHHTLQYSGAKRPLFVYRNGEFEEVKADKQSIGGLEMEDHYTFTNHNFELKKGDTFYMFTDGYVDQFGGDKEKKYSTKRLKDTLTSIQSLSLKQQGIELDTIIENWKNGIEQIDDILVIGIRF